MEAIVKRGFAKRSMRATGMKRYARVPTPPKTVTMMSRFTQLMGRFTENCVEGILMCRKLRESGQVREPEQKQQYSAHGRQDTYGRGIPRLRTCP